MKYGTMELWFTMENYGTMEKLSYYSENYGTLIYEGKKPWKITKSKKKTFDFCWKKTTMVMVKNNDYYNGNTNICLFLFGLLQFKLHIQKSDPCITTHE